MHIYSLEILLSFINILGDDKFEHAYKHFIDSKDVLELLCLKFMFLGPPRLGKSTTRRRVMKEIVDLQSAEEAEQVHGSTGTVECFPSMLVQDELDQDMAESLADWTIVQSLNDEASLLFHSLKDSLQETNSVAEASAHSYTEGIETTGGTRRDESTESQPSLLHRIIGRVQSLTTKKQLPEPEQFTPPSPTKAKSDNDWVVSPDYSEIAAIFKEVSQQCAAFFQGVSANGGHWRPA